MQEREQYNLALTTAETMYNLWELRYTEEEPNLDAMMLRLKDLNAYSLTHAEIMVQREMVELLALAMFFGATSNPAFHQNQARLRQLSLETIAYQGRSEIIEKEVAMRKAKPAKKLDEDDDSYQMRLL